MFAGYSVVNPRVTSVTQQQLITSTQSLYRTQTVTSIGTQTITSIGTQTVSSIGAATSVAVAATATPSFGSSNYNQFCAGYGCYCNAFPPNRVYNYCYSSGPVYYSNGSPFPSCQSTSDSGKVRCVGYLYQPVAGCEELAVPIDNAFWSETRVYQYYRLMNMSSLYLPLGLRVAVNGQLSPEPYDYTASGSTCPINYIVVNSITQQ
jgi:hypothetical protein